MKQRKVFALLLAFVMTLSTTTAFAASDFTDVPEDAYYEVVETAAAGFETAKTGDTGTMAEYAPMRTMIEEMIGLSDMYKIEREFRMD